MDLRRILRYIVFSAIFLIPFVPLYVSGVLFFPFITGKAFLFRTLVEIAFGSWLVLSLYDKSYWPKRSWLLYATTLFVAGIALADILGGHFLKSFWSNFERMEGLVTLLHLWAYFTVLISVVKTEKIWERLMQTSIAVSLIIGSWGFLQLFGLFTSVQSGTRLDASFGNASYLAVYMLFHVFLTSYLLFKSDGLKRWLYALITFFQAFILIFTATRGAILGLIGGVFVTTVLIAFLERENKFVRKMALSSIVAVVLVVALFLPLRNSSLVQNIEPLQRLASISLNDRTTISRFTLWNMAFDAFKEKPLLGWGQENFIFAFEKYYDPAMYAQEPWFDRAHNVIFDWLIAGGLLGITSYLLILLFALFYLWRNPNLNIVSKSLFTGLLAAYFFHNLFVFDNIASYILYIFVLAFIHFNIRGEEESEEEDSNFQYRSIIASFLIVLTVFSIYFFNVKGYLTSRALLQALSPQAEGVGENLKYYEKALSYNSYGNQEIREQLISATSVVLNSNVSQELKEKFVVLGLDEMQRQVDEFPESARANIFMGSFLNRLKLYDQALPFLEKGLELSPEKQATYFEFVTNYLNAGQVDKAVQFAKNAYELDTRFNDARIIYAVTLIYNNQKEEAVKILNEKFGEKFGDSRLAQAYFTVGDYNGAIREWQNIISREPQNTQHRTSLAATLLEAGRRAEAIEVLEEAIQVNPEFKEQGEYFISEIKAGRNP